MSRLKVPTTNALVRLHAQGDYVVAQEEQKSPLICDKEYKLYLIALLSNMVKVHCVCLLSSIK